MARKGKRKNNRKLLTSQERNLIGEAREEYTGSLLERLREKSKIKDFKFSGKGSDLDRKGIDVRVWLKGEKERRVSIDIKSSLTGVYYAMAKIRKRNSSILIYIPNFDDSKKEMERLLSLMEAHWSKCSLTSVVQLEKIKG